MIEPKFNVGDLVYMKEYASFPHICTIESIDEDCYYCDQTNFDIEDQVSWYKIEEGNHLRRKSDGLKATIYSIGKNGSVSVECDGWKEDAISLKDWDPIMPASFYMRPTPIFKFNIGDTIRDKRGFLPSFTIDRIVGMDYIGENGEQVGLAMQDDWELAEGPKFKVGDKIRFLNGCGTIMTIDRVEDGMYVFANDMGHISIEEGNKWSLVEEHYPMLNGTKMMTAAESLGISEEEYAKLEDELFNTEFKSKPKNRFVFKALPRLLEMLEPTDRAKTYTKGLIAELEKEGYMTDAKIIRECLNMMEGKKVPMATMD